MFILKTATVFSEMLLQFCQTPVWARREHVTGAAILNEEFHDL
jgi:hypothetical protein